MRTSVLATLLLAACGDNAGSVVDAAIADTHVIDTPIDTPTIAQHTHYIIDKVTVPASNTQARMLGLDLNGDGTVDNQLGMVFATLAGMGFPLQANVDFAIDHG